MYTTGPGEFTTMMIDNNNNNNNGFSNAFSSINAGNNQANTMEFLRCATAQQLIFAGNGAYSQLQLTVEQQRRTIELSKMEKYNLELQLAELKGKCTTMDEFKLLLDEHARTRAPMAHDDLFLTTTNNLPPQLKRDGYPNVKYWTAKEWNKRDGRRSGETTVASPAVEPVTKAYKHGHPYLQLEDGSVVTDETMTKVGQKTRRVLLSLLAKGVAPTSWGKITAGPENYYFSEILKLEDFQFFRYCDDNWKLRQYITQTYPSFKTNHHPEGAKAKKKQVRTSTAIEDESEVVPSTSDVSTGPPNSGSSATSARPALAAGVQPSSESSTTPIPAFPLRSPLDSDDENDPGCSNEPQLGFRGGDGDSASNSDTAGVMPSTSSARPASTQTTTITGTTDTTNATLPGPTAPTQATATPVIDPVDPSTALPDSTPVPPRTNESPSFAGPTNKRNLKKRGRKPNMEGDSTSDRPRKLVKLGKVKNVLNLCKEKWLETHPGGYEDEFKVYYDSLSQSDLQVFKDRINAEKPKPRLRRGGMNNGQTDTNPT